jgi:hypothetical protein
MGLTLADWTTVAEGDDLPAGEMIEVDNRGEPLVIARGGRPVRVRRLVHA